jgi:integrase
MAKSYHALHRRVRRKAGHTGLVERNNGIWHVRIYRNGKEVTRTTGCRDEDEAALAAARIRRDLEAGGNGRSTAQPPPLKVEVSIEDICRLAAEARHTEQGAAGKKTISTYCTKIRGLAKRLQVETVLDLEYALTMLREYPPRDLSPVSVESYLGSSRSLFSVGRLNYYRDHGYLVQSPFRNFKIGNIIPKEVEVMPIPEAEVLKGKMESLKFESPALYRSFLLIFHAGLRAQEATHLKWEDITEKGVIKVRPDRFSKWEPKFGRPRRVPLHGSAYQNLLSTKLPKDHKEDYIVPLKIYCPQVYRDTETRAQDVLEELNQWLGKHSQYLSELNNRNHALRKYYITLIANKLGIFVARCYAGHVSVKTTERYYAAMQELPTVEI